MYSPYLLGPWHNSVIIWFLKSVFLPNSSPYNKIKPYQFDSFHQIIQFSLRRLWCMSKIYQKIDMEIRVYFNASLISIKIYNNFMYFHFYWVAITWNNILLPVSVLNRDYICSFRSLFTHKHSRLIHNRTATDHIFLCCRQHALDTQAKLQYFFCISYQSSHWRQFITTGTKNMTERNKSDSFLGFTLV